MPKSLKRVIGESYVKYKIRVSRGGTFTSEVTAIMNSVQQGGILLLLVNQYTHWLLPLWLIPALWFIKQGVEYFMGWYDQTHLHWQQFENQYNAEMLSPWNTEIMNRVKNIEESLKR